MIILNKRCAIEAYVVKKMSEIIVLEQEKMDMLTSNEFLIEKNIIDLLSGKINHNEFANIVNEKTKALKEINEKIKKTDKELNVIISAAGNGQYHQFTFE